MKTYLRYWLDMIRCAATGSARYWGWLAFLGALVLAGGAAWGVQLAEGLVVTHLSDQVSWGAYVANLTFLVGIAAAAVLLVVPTYVYHREDVKEVVLIAELVAATAIVMCLLFILVDLGRPDRFLHIVPGLGRLNLRSSLLAWDAVVLNGYLLLNLHVPGYLLYQRWLGRAPAKLAYLPFVFLSIGWAISIHTVTAFLYLGFGGRPFWNTAIMAPRFLVSAFASGPSLLILIFTALEVRGGRRIPESIFGLLRRIVAYALPANFFLLGCEMFKEFYTDNTHVASAEYLFFGLHGHAMLVPYMWGAIVMGLVAIAIFTVPALHRRRRTLVLGAVLCVLGVWIEKGMGLVVPGFIPTPTGDLVEYAPSIVEFLVCLGIWAFGALLFSVMAKVALAIQHGELRARSVGRP